MILTITLNPSIDIRYNLSHFETGKVHRAITCEKTAGGKGLNVARIIKKLNCEVLTTGFLGGKLGEDLEEKLNFQGIKNDFEKIQGETRNCINILHDEMSSEILENGPVISEKEWQNFKEKFILLTEKYKYISASGSLPAGLSQESYCELIDIANKNKCKFFLDTSGPFLEKSIKAKPYFIKPNSEELEKLTGKNINDIEDVIAEAKKLNAEGIEIVAVTLGGDGAVLITSNEILIAEIPKINVLNTVGCGDSFVGGFVSGISKNLSILEAFKLAVACSMSNALLPETGNIDDNVVKQLLKEIKIISKK